jgi:4-hydroxybenzoate polyprenyltransferase
VTLLRAYARERLVKGRVLSAGLLVSLAALSGRGWSGPAAAATDVAAALGLVIAFRMWDDVADRDRDRARHPDRILVSAPSIGPVRSAAWAIAAAAAALVGVTRGPASLALIGVYAVLLAASYAARGARSAARDRILLLKYGVFTLALIGLPAASTARGLLWAGAAFVAACVYEWWHDAESPVFSFGGSR